MGTKGKPKRGLYGTKQVAWVLRVDEWRVKNFSEGAAYRLPPKVQVGSGRGSRRLYDWQGVLRIALANELVECGFTPETVGKAVREVPESELTFGDPEKPDAQYLVCLRGKWKLRTKRQVRTMLDESPRGLFVISLWHEFYDIYKRLEEYEVTAGKGYN